MVFVLSVKTKVAATIILTYVTKTIIIYLLDRWWEYEDYKPIMHVSGKRNKDDTEIV